MRVSGKDWLAPFDVQAFLLGILNAGGKSCPPWAEPWVCDLDYINTERKP